MDHPIYSLKNAAYFYGGVRAVRDAQIDLYPGRIHALLGEPGCGKSTLGKIVAGGLSCRHGEAQFRQRTYKPSSFAAALRAGVAYCGQRPQMVGSLSLAENLRLGRESSASSEQLRAGLEKLGLQEYPLTGSAAGLPPAARQLAGVLRAANPLPKLLVLDEPGNGLNAAELRRLQTFLRQLAEQGVGILYITSSSAEAFAIAAEFTILRDGHTIPVQPMTAVKNAEELQALIPGCSPGDIYPAHSHKMSETLLEAIGLKIGGKEISFTLRRGEILGLAGLSGAGRCRLARALCGLEPAAGGILSAKGKNFKARQLDPQRARQAGILLVDGCDGLDDNAYAGVNILLPSMQQFGCCGLFRPRRAETAAAAAITASGLAPETGEKTAGELSAFERQMTGVLRAQQSGCDIIIFNQPGRGVKTTRKHDLFRKIYALAASGKGVILISNYQPELQQACDTIAVLHQGELCPPRPAGKWTSEEITLYATSGKFGALSLL